MQYNSKLSQVPSEDILTRLIHPSVFTLLELATPPVKNESSESNDIRSEVYRGKKGHLLVRCDGIRLLIEGWQGEKLILRCALRDRQLDGTDKTSPLTVFPNTDPACNRLPAPDFLAAELSIYSWDPATYLDGLDVEGTLGHFLADPDFYIWREYDPETYLALWQQAFYIGRAPWQVARPMSGVPRFFVKQAIKLLTEIGYHRVDAVPSWYNVAKFFKLLGFKFTYGEHELAYEGITVGLKQFASQNNNANQAARPLTSPQEAWLVALQNIPAEDIPEELRLPSRWPVTHTNQYWVRMHLDLNKYERKPRTASTTLLRKVSAMRDPAHVHDKLVLHHAHCPCTDKVGASSPAATGPAATSHPESDAKE
ncbi:MAG TPA: hypothetical protein V6D08_00675 [Candidatus Obscuribacterales bacterium]